MMNNKQHNMKH